MRLGTETGAGLEDQETEVRFLTGREIFLFCVSGQTLRSTQPHTQWYSFAGGNTTNHSLATKPEIKTYNPAL